MQAVKLEKLVKSKIKEWRTRSAELQRDVRVANLTRQSLSNDLHQQIEELELLLDQHDLLEKSNKQLLSDLAEMIDEFTKDKVMPLRGNNANFVASTSLSSHATCQSV